LQTFKCPICDFIAKTKRALGRHKNSHRSCDFCGKGFVGERAQREFDSHMKMHEKEIKCMHCKNIYKNKTAYLKHFKSEICTK